jgi:hypothetical protein
MSRKTSQPVKKQAQVSTFDRLMIRVKGHVESPKAQHNHMCRVERLDSDNDDDWERMIEDLSYTDGVEVKANDQSVELNWSPPPAQDD